MSLAQDLLSPLSLQDFVRDYYLQRPFGQTGLRQLEAPLQALIDRGDRNWLGHLIEQPNADFLFVGGVGSSDGPALDIPGHLSRGATLRIRHAEAMDEELGLIARSFSREFLAPVDIHVYCTPAAKAGLAWHYDIEDVFIFQLRGQKKWLVRKNTVNPWPVAETMPADMKIEREIMPAIGCELEPGAWLYVPNGYWHRTEAGDESISISIGIGAPTALELLDFARVRLVDSIRWRQRLSPSRLGESETMHDLAAALAKELSSPAFSEEFWNYRRIRYTK